MSPERITLAITGASGAQYGLRLLRYLLAAEKEVFVIISKAARVVIGTETDLRLPAGTKATTTALREYVGHDKGTLTVCGLEQWTSPVASGSGAPSTMVVVPCSTGTLSAIATGASNNLIERAADVAIKEQRQLILVPRETPLSAIHLENMLKLRSEEHTSELQSRGHLVCRLLPEKQTETRAPALLPLFHDIAIE